MSKKKSNKKDSEAEMSFLEHLEELRWHIVRSVLAIVLFGIVAFIYHDYIFDNVIFAPTQSWFPTYQFFCMLGERMCFSPPDLNIETVTMGEAFFVSLSVSFWLGFIVSFPYVFYQFWSFIKPGLYDNERKAARGVVGICSILFLTGILFGYYGISPFAIKFLGSFDVGTVVSTNTTSIKSLVGYITMITIPAGIIFELPVVIFFLAKIGLVTPAFLRKYRKHAYVLILILAAIITPPDITTQFMIGVPVFGLYELSIWIAARVAKKNQQALTKT